MNTGIAANISAAAVDAYNATAHTGLSGIITDIFSLPALRDWVKLAVIGGFIQLFRQFDVFSWTGWLDTFWITAVFTEEDVSYAWILYWLSTQPSWNKTKRVEVYTRTLAALVYGGDREDDAERKVTYLPSMDSTYHLRYQGHCMSVCRHETATGFRSSVEKVKVCILSRDKTILDELIQEARELYDASRRDMITVYTSDVHDSWNEVATRPKRPLRSVVLEPGVKDLLLNDAQDFLLSKDWYTERGIPFRRGYLLYGAPGTGKTSMIQAIAGELGLNIYVISLSRAGLDDTSLSAIIADLPKRCIALMEDVDVAFSQTVRRSRVDTGQDDQKDAKDTDTEAEEEKTRTSRVTLSGLLNALDGVGAQEGRILFATTNRYDALDPALCRPGRMDLHVEFKLASKYQAAELFKCFYMPSHHDPKKHERSGAGEQPRPSTAHPPVESEKSHAAVYTGALSSVRAPVLSLQETQALSQRFADAIPERRLSMASLQGYLMTYKTRPLEAVDVADAWVVEQLRKLDA